MVQAKRWKLIFEKDCRFGIHLKLVIGDQELASYDRNPRILGMQPESSDRSLMNLGMVLGNCDRNLMMGSRVHLGPSQQKECGDPHLVLVQDPMECFGHPIRQHVDRYDQMCLISSSHCACAVALAVELGFLSRRQEIPYNFCRRTQKACVEDLEG